MSRVDNGATQTCHITSPLLAPSSVLLSLWLYFLAQHFISEYLKVVFLVYYEEEEGDCHVILFEKLVTVLGIELRRLGHDPNSLQTRHVRFWAKVGHIGPNWINQGLFRSDSSTLKLAEPKYAEIWSERAPDLGPIWSTLGTNMSPLLTSVL